ncbi:MAG: DUF5666 domain-containing protein [Candidatus Komeilibacteria bacterium]|nr:DUF5666 domain-containing protein [Candidatus Komeilibacteria bacterium]
MIKIKNKYISLAVLASLVLAVPVLAQTNNSQSSESRDNKGGLMNWGRMMMGRVNMMSPNIVGTVTAINGTTLTVTSNSKVGWAWGKEDEDGDEDNQNEDTPKATPAPIVYTVDASQATVVKAGVASTVSGIAVGDIVKIQGTVTGTSILATTIRDGVNKEDKEKDKKEKDKENKDKKPEQTPLIQGNGQPIIAGTVTAINGTTLTITNKSNVTYTVNASSAKIVNKKGLSTVSTIVVGDNVIVQGAINGTAITAYSVIDQGATPSPSVKPNDQEEGRGKFFGGIGKFFQHLFGF